MQLPEVRLPEETPSLGLLLKAQLEAWPEHADFLRKRFPASNGAGLEEADQLASLILRLAGPELPSFCSDYRWLCDRVFEEELYFRRSGRYRLSKFEDALREVYANREYMARYMNGLLMSQVWWANHSSVIDFYVTEFLKSNAEGYSHLEVGPGHGLLLYFAARDPRCAEVCAWDVSDASIDATKAALGRLGVERPVRLVSRSVFEPNQKGELFDSIVISEVCEHLEEPDHALANLRTYLSDRGQIFVNVPVNSPAPDHIYLLNTPEEAVQLVKRSGFEIVHVKFAPATGYTEEKARRLNATISCMIVGRKSGV